jgi:hypothetical protein
MAETATKTGQPSFDLDILGQMPTLKLYTQLTFCYPLKDTSSKSGIAQTLSDGLERLAKGFPWVAGQVSNEGASEGNSGIFKIVPYKDIPLLIVKDYTDNVLVPSFEEMQKAEFPMRMFDEKLVAPRDTVPVGPEDVAPGLFPVFLVQINFIKGGLLLTVNAEHQAMDLIGQVAMISLLSKACHNEPFTEGDLKSGNWPRRDVVPFLDADWEPGPELSRQIAKSEPATIVSTEGVIGTSNTAPAPAPASVWNYFSFNAQSLATLKETATNDLVGSSGFASTDDVLTGLVWKAVIKARLPRLNLSQKCSFGRGIDVRKYFDVPATYPGMLQTMNVHTLTVEEVSKASLGKLGLEFRSQLDPKLSDIRQRAQALATTLNRTADKSPIDFAVDLDTTVDFMLSSWAKADCWNFEFNLGLGKPESVRRPRLMPFPGLAYFMPKSRDGEISLAICLVDYEMERLRKDEDFGKYARFIG